MPVSVCLCIVSYRWVHHLVVSSLVLDLEVRGGDADGVVPGELGDASGGLPGGGAGGDSPGHGPADGHCLNFVRLKNLSLQANEPFISDQNANERDMCNIFIISDFMLTDLALEEEMAELTAEVIWGWRAARIWRMMADWSTAGAGAATTARTGARTAGLGAALAATATSETPARGPVQGPEYICCNVM